MIMSMTNMTIWPMIYHITFLSSVFATNLSSLLSIFFILVSVFSTFSLILLVKITCFLASTEKFWASSFNFATFAEDLSIRLLNWLSCSLAIFKIYSSSFPLVWEYSPSVPTFSFRSILFTNLRVSIVWTKVRNDFQKKLTLNFRVGILSLPLFLIRWK